MENIVIALESARSVLVADPRAPTLAFHTDTLLDLFEAGVVLRLPDVAACALSVLARTVCDCAPAERAEVDAALRAEVVLRVLFTLGPAHTTAVCLVLKEAKQAPCFAAVAVCALWAAFAHAAPPCRDVGHVVRGLGLLAGPLAAEAKDNLGALHTATRICCPLEDAVDLPEAVARAAEAVGGGSGGIHPGVLDDELRAAGGVAEAARAIRSAAVGVAALVHASAAMGSPSSSPSDSWSMRTQMDELVSRWEADEITLTLDDACAIVDEAAGAADAIPSALPDETLAVLRAAYIAPEEDILQATNEHARMLASPSATIKNRLPSFAPTFSNPYVAVRGADPLVVAFLEDAPAPDPWMRIAEVCAMVDVMHTFLGSPETDNIQVMCPRRVLSVEEDRALLQFEVPTDAVLWDERTPPKRVCCASLAAHILARCVLGMSPIHPDMLYYAPRRKRVVCFDLGIAARGSFANLTAMQHQWGRTIADRMTRAMRGDPPPFDMLGPSGTADYYRTVWKRLSLKRTYRNK